MKIEPKTKIHMGIIGLLSTILFAASAYYYHQAHTLQIDVANLSNGTQLEPGLPFSLMVRIIITIVIGFASLAMIAKGRQGNREVTR